MSNPFFRCSRVAFFFQIVEEFNRYSHSFYYGNFSRPIIGSSQIRKQHHIFPFEYTEIFFTEITVFTSRCDPQILRQIGAGNKGAFLTLDNGNRLCVIGGQQVFTEETLLLD